MKVYSRSILSCAAAVGIGIWSTAAVAVNLIYEPFDYTSSTALLGQVNTSAGTTAGAVPNTWLRAAPAATPANSINIASGSLTGPLELKSSVGNSLSITDGSNNGAADRLAFRSDATSASNISSGAIYYSFVLRVDSLTGANNVGGDYFLSLNNTANAATTANPTVHPAEMRARIDPNDSSKFSLGMFTQHASVTQGDAAWVNGLTVGQSIFVVGQYNVGTTNSTKLWINPDPLTFGLASAPVTFSAQDTVSGTNGNSIGSLLLHQRNVVPDLTMDELRVATTWAEVTPLGSPTLYWDIDGSTPGAGGATPSGTWDSSTNWNNSAAGDGTALAWTSGGAATFSAGTDATGSYTVNVSGTQSASQVTFEDGSVTLAGGQLNLTGSLHTLVAGSSVTATIQSVVGGSVGMIKDGTGTVVLTATETYSGDTTISGGTLQVGNGGTTGALPTGGNLITNGTLTFNRSNNVTQGTDFSSAPISGTGGITQAGGGTLTLNAANTFSGSTRAAAGTLKLSNSLALQNSVLDLNGADSGTVVIDNSLSAATIGALGGTRNFALVNGASGAVAVTVGSASGSYSGALSGAGSLIKSGSGTQTLSGANTYSGSTTINAGTLQFAQTVSMPVGGGSSADYNGNGTVDTADYVMWRKSPASFGNNPGYTAWRASYGSAAGGSVIVNSGGTLAVNAGGSGEWTDSTVVSDPASLAGLIAGTGGQGTANQITWNAGSSLAVDTTNAASGLTYNGVIGGFRTTGGTTNAVGFTKRGVNTLTLTANNTFSGSLNIAPSGGTLVLMGTNANAGTSTALPTVGIGSNSSLELGVSNALPSGSLIQTQGASAQLFVNPGVNQTVRSLSGNNGVVTVKAGATLTIADQAGDNYVLGNGAGTANLRSEDTAKIYKTGAGTFTLFGDAGSNFLGEFIMQNGRLNLSRNQALGTTGGTGKLTVTGGQLGRTDTPTSNFTYSIGILDMQVFRFDLSDAPAQTSQISGNTITTLKANNVEINITNSGAQTSNSGRFNFLGDIRNHDPSPSGGDDPFAIRGITKTGNGVLTFANATTYRGSSTISDGILLLTSTSGTMATLGDYTQPTIGTLNLKGGILATNATRTSPVKNPIVVDGAAGIGHLSTTNSLASVVMEFDTDSVVGTSGSLTISNLNSGTGNTVFRPLFTGKSFNFGLPITISAATGTTGNIKSNELEFGNFSDTQTFSGVISGGGSVRRVNAGGTTVLSGLNTYTGSTSVDAGTLSITQAYLADAADVALATGGIFDLNFAGTDTIARLLFDGVAQAVGTWGAPGSGATNTSSFFTGSGILNVTSASGSGLGLEAASVPEPASLTLTIVGLTLFAAGRRRRRNYGC